MNFFVIDSPLMRTLGKIGDIIFLNLLFVATSIPLFTIGTALSAMYTVTMKIVRGQEPAVIREYFRAYKRNFRTATVCWVVMALAAALMFVDFRLIGVLEGTVRSAARILLGAVLGLWCLMFLYLFPYIARFENTILQSMKNAWMLSVAHLPSTLLMLIITGGLVIATLYTSTSFVIATILWTFFGFAAVAWVQSYLLVRIFSKYE